MKYLIAFAVLLLALSVEAANPGFGDFNNTQFGTTGNKVNLKVGAVLTNGVFHGTATFDGTNYFNWVVITNVVFINFTNAGTTYFNSNYVNVQYVTNLYVTTNVTFTQTVSNQYVTIQYVTNQTVITNSTFVQYVTNLFVDASYITNLTVISNLNVNGKLTVNNFYATDGTITNGLYFVTNSWSGPTNPIDLRFQDQYYDTLTPMLISGFSNKSNSVSQSVLLTVRNLSSTNVTLTLPVGVREASGTNAYTLLAGTTNDMVISLRYSPASGGHTNAVNRRLWSP